MNIFHSTTRPDEKLFYSRNDPNDLKMGEHVQRDPAEYDDAQVVILGCPQDEGVRRNKGRIGAAKAPAAIRQQFYKFSVQANLMAANLFDLGDVKIKEKLEDTHTLLSDVVAQVLKHGKQLIILGGGNDISYADCLGLSRTSGDILAFNIDSHYDVRADQPSNSGTPYRQLLEEKIVAPQSFYEMAIKSLTNSTNYTQYLNELGVNIFSLEELRQQGIRKIFQQILQKHHSESIFWGFDMDAVRSSDAPGVSASYPIGLTADESCDIAEIAGTDQRTKIFEISEVNPNYDIDNRTNKLAAMMIVSFLVARFSQ